MTPTKVLEMVHCCKDVTHLSLPEHTKVSLHNLEVIVKTLTHLQQLEVFVVFEDIVGQFIEGLLKISSSSVRELKLQSHSTVVWYILRDIQECADRGYPLPSVISFFSGTPTTRATKLFKFWLESGSKLPPFEIRLYEDERMPLKLCPPVLLRRYKFGPAAKVPLIRLSSYGIVGLNHDIFHFTEYNHYGTVRHALTPEHFKHLPVEEKHIDHSINSLHSVSYIDLYCLSKIHSDYLKQLTLLCPNLQVLN